MSLIAWAGCSADPSWSQEALTLQIPTRGEVQVPELVAPPVWSAQTIVPPVVDTEPALPALGLPARQVHIEGLSAGLARYQAMRDAGGWPLVETWEPWDVGADAAEIGVLRDRLNREGYAAGGLGTVYDEHLAEAVRAFQVNHQIEATGILDEDTVDALNVPLVERIAEIEVTLEKLRAAQTEEAPAAYVWVNLPDFHAEVWDQGGLAMRFRVVVGESVTRRNRDGSVRYPNATPLLSSAIERVVFNPSWTVPSRIWNNELRSEAESDPDYLANNNFDRIVTDDGREVIRQRPGPDNALGQFKFVFPNDFSVYMHDTQSRRLFNEPVRAFSHGCVRVEDPRAFAEWLVSHDQGLSADETDELVDRQLRGHRERGLELTTPVPVYLEYYTVRAAADGSIQFLSDIYQTDSAAVEARLDEIEAVQDLAVLEQ